jgi:molecular chaperone GrpE (heat shock protein)
MKFFGGDKKEGKKEVKEEKKEGFFDTLANGLEGMEELVDAVDAQDKEIKRLNAKVELLEKQMKAVLKYLGV